ncbi:MAG: phage minor head protein [Pikeienuella sp.]
MAEYSDKPGYAFRTGPPEEVERFMKGKSNRESFSWMDFEPEEHAAAFTVAKAMQLDVLDAIREGLQKAMDEGLTYEAFRQDLEPRLRALGWWGRKDMVDPATGKPVSARLGSPRRLRTIWRANMRAAHAAGQWERAQRTKRALPYFLYLLGPSREHRIEHQAREGLIYPVDHPFWDHWFPPNGWGCKCHVRQITAREAERRGISEEPAMQWREWRNPRSGEVRRVPRGVDPAWAGNPGKARMANLDAHLAGRLEGADPAVARAAIFDMATSWRARRIHEGSASGAVPVAMLSESAAEALGAKTRVALYSSETAEKERRKHGDAALDLLALTQEAFDGPDVFPDDRSRVAFVEVRGKLWRIVLKATQDKAEIYITSFHRSNPKQLEKWRRRSGGDG